VSGVGYCFGDRYAELYRGAEGVRDGFLDLTAEYMRRMGLRCVWTSSTTGQRLSRYAERLSDLTALLPDYGRLPGTTPANANELVHGVPVFHALTTFDPKGGPEEARELLVREIRQFTPPERPAFMHVFVQCYPCSPSLLKQVLVEVGPDYVPVLPEQLADLYKAARG